ncbi:TPA: hypothetical protein LR291_003359 [Escherichia coli]|nr:hypothetical protein [Escherichia coli]
MQQRTLSYSQNVADGKVLLTPAQLAMLLEGIDWRQPKRLLTSLTML